MFIGHWAPALAAAAVSKRAPKLGVLFIAAQLVDWAFFLFAMVGIEKMRVVPGITAMNPMDLYHLPYTHSLVGTAVFALAFAAILVLGGRQAITAALGAVVVLSHWLVDVVVHRPDMTLAGGDSRIGLGLWNYPAIAIGLELVIVFGAFAFYIARTRGPMLPPWILLAVLLLLQAINWFGPPPERAGLELYLTALAAFALATAIAFWVGSTRRHVQDRGLAVGGMRR